MDQSDSTITAEATLAADVPTCVIVAASEGGAIASAPLSADPVSMPPTDASCFGYMKEPGVQPKDFALIFAQGTFPVFYIRQVI